jgi:hypothetical protein
LVELDRPAKVEHDLLAHFAVRRFTGAYEMRACKLPVAIRHAVLTLALACWPSGANAQAKIDVDLALVLAVDCSGSVDDREYELSMRGIASALRDPEIMEAIERWTPNGVAIAVVHWSGWHAQQVAAVDWTRIADRASAEALATQIETRTRALSGDTSIGGLLRFANDFLENAPFRSARRIIDVAGDGESSSGYSPDRFRNAAVAMGTTINGLAILNEFPALDQYYAERVIGGPEAFVVAARDYDDFARAMRFKLLQEIRGAPLG